MNITSKIFFEKWIETVTEDEENLSKNWRNNRKITELIIRDENSIICKIAKKLNLLCYNQDYYCLDAIFYLPEDKVINLPDYYYWFQNIRIAFEHENHFNSGLYQEVSHLLITNCDLRVLVTYPNGDEKEEYELNYLHKIISQNPSNTDISQKESFIIIFGYENNFEWIGYIYKKDGWKIIKPNSTTEEFKVINHP
nr:hypothetical protein [uncultured Flavobacterium sp.]